MACLLVLAAAPRAAAPVTYANDAARTGWYPDQPTLSPQSVVSSSFGQLWSTPVDGQVYAQPLLSNGTLFVATENNWIYGMDPRTGAVRWQRNVGEAFDPTSFCGDLVPRIGVTGTPVIDPDTGTAYFFSKTYTTDSGGTKSPAWFAHAVDMTNGDERSGFPVKIEGDAENAPGTPFSANTEGQRPGLLLMNGVVYAGFAGHCDQFDFRGWIVGVSTSGHITTMWTSRPLPGTGAGIWQSGGGLVSDGSDQILFATGNGGAPTPPMAGKTPPSLLGESVVRLGVQPGRNLRATDFFAPYDGAQLDGWDADLGSGAPVALPDSFGTSKVRRLLVQPGKEGYVYLLNRDSLGGTGQGPGGGDAVVDRIGPYGGAWSHPAVWPGDGGYVYIPTASSGFVPGTGLLRAYKRGVDASNEPTLSLAGSSTDGFGFGSGAPVVSSDGTTTGSAVVWTIWSPDGSAAAAHFRASPPAPDANHPLTPMGTGPIGTA